MAMHFTAHEQAFLADQRLGRVATASPSGEPDVAPVTFRIDDDGRIRIDGFDNPKTVKWRNVAATGRAAFVVDDLATIDPWAPRGIKLRGSATAGTDADGRHVIRIMPEIIWSWGINPDAEKHFAGIIERRTVDGAS
jgi:pyridoxamine 5'-phosphate oxidase family protein